MMEIFAAFSKQTGIPIEPLFGNMQQVLEQARTSGTIRVIIGDRSFLDAAPVSIPFFQAIGKGRLVLAFRKGLTIESLKGLLCANVHRIGIADEQKAVYGKAAKECLDRSGLYDRLRGKLLVAATVPQISAYLVLGEVDAAFLNLTEALSIERHIGGYLKADESFYTSIEIGAGILPEAKNDEDVGRLLAFLKTKEAKAILLRYGL